MNASLRVVAVIIAIIIAVEFFFSRPISKRISWFAPEPFWIYFLSILCGLSGVVPNEAPVYKMISLYILPAAIFLMLVGSPVSDLLRLGRNAAIAMALASISMFIAVIVCFAAMHRWLPPESWKAAGAILGTWVGGSANMIAVKEILSMPNDLLAPLIIMDTVLSYGWLAFLLLGVGLQGRFDQSVGETTAELTTSVPGPSRTWRFPRWSPVPVALVVALLCAAGGTWLGGVLPAIPSTGWTLILATLSAILGALTPLRGIEASGASERGRIALYVVLAAIGSRTQLQSTGSAPAYLLFGVSVLLTHGALLLTAARFARVSLFLAATASQANVGGAVSAPIVAEAYRRGTAPVGVLMAVAGLVLGTWAGIAGGWVCRWIERWMA